MRSEQADVNFCRQPTQKEAGNVPVYGLCEFSSPQFPAPQPAQRGITETGRAARTVRLDLHDEIYASQGRIASLYFPDDAMISLVTQMKSGASVEVGVVGRYGMAGLSVFLGSDRAPSDAFVQVGGTGFKMALSDFRDVVKPTTRLHSRLLAYTNSYLFQSSQAAACNALHNVEQRSARWLLTVADQIGADEFELTHEFLAQMLGVRRAGVTEAQAILRSKGLIESRRGRISIRDRSGTRERWPVNVSASSTGSSKGARAVRLARRGALVRNRTDAPPPSLIWTSLKFIQKGSTWPPGTQRLCWTLDESPPA